MLSLNALSHCCKRLSETLHVTAMAYVSLHDFLIQRKKNPKFLGFSLKCPTANIQRALEFQDTLTNVEKGLFYYSIFTHSLQRGKDWRLLLPSYR